MIVRFVDVDEENHDEDDNDDESDADEYLPAFISSSILFFLFCFVFRINFVEIRKLEN